MIGKRRVVAVMMIRDGSRRIQNKNMKIMCGRPLARIMYDMLIKCKYIDEIYISTSSYEYARIALAWGANVIDRPRKLSGDKVILTEVMRHAASVLKHLKDDDFILQVEPTKPLGKSKYFNEVIKHAHKHNLDSCFTVKELKENLIGDMAVVSQDKPKSEKRYVHFGFVRLRTKATTLTCSGWGEGKKHANLPLIQPWEIDIDYPWQWIIAEALLKEDLPDDEKLEESCTRDS